MSAKRKQGGGKRPIPLKKVQAGDAFLAPLADGRLCVCRVHQVAPDGDVLVSASTWIGTQAPDPADRQLREVLRLTHHSFRDEPCLVWVGEPVPATVTRLGVIPPTHEEASLPCAAFSGWEFLPHAVLLQWRWDHERDQVLAEDKAEERAKEAARERQRRAYEPLLPDTLQDLRLKTPFPGWAGYVKPAALRGSRRLIRDLLDALTALGPEASEPARLDELYQCVERFNLLDGDDQFIDSIERDDICALLDEIGAMIGLDDYGEDLDGNREW